MVQLAKRDWQIGKQIGEGGFARVYEATSDGEMCSVAKLIPKLRGATRDMLVSDLGDARNVIPILDDGEDGDDWILIMPRAEKSLREQIAHGITEVEAIQILHDIVDTLIDLNGHVVHRDIKPENILFFNGHWCLTDFGIARYADKTTASNTLKDYRTPVYAAPEIWRNERATTATDVYAVGVLIYEMVTGVPPFNGDTLALQHAHLNTSPPLLNNVSDSLRAIAMTCLSKDSRKRPTPIELSNQLQSNTEGREIAEGPGLASLREANLRETNKQNKIEMARAEAEAKRTERINLFAVAKNGFNVISSALKESIASAAYSGEVTGKDEMFNITLGTSEFHVSNVTDRTMLPDWNAYSSFDVIAHSQVTITIPDRNGYQGRSHSLWYCDAHEEGQFEWFELAFMYSPLIKRYSPFKPFALKPDHESAQALAPITAQLQVAWPMEPVTEATLKEFINRWASWFAKAVNGSLSSPSVMPEVSIERSWRC